MRCIDCAGSGVVPAHGLVSISCPECDGTGQIADDKCGNCGGAGCQICNESGMNLERRREERRAYNEDRCRDDY